MLLILNIGSFIVFIVLSLIVSKIIQDFDITILLYTSSILGGFFING